MTQLWWLHIQKDPRCNASPFRFCIEKGVMPSFQEQSSCSGGTATTSGTTGECRLRSSTGDGIISRATSNSLAHTHLDCDAHRSQTAEAYSPSSRDRSLRAARGGE